MNTRPLESLTKEELIEIIRHERGHNDMVNDNAPAIDKTSDSVLNAKYTDGYISGYVVACNFAASLASEAWVNHVFHTGLDGLIERCKNMEQVLLEKAQACQESGRYKQTTQELVKHEHIADARKMAPEGWKLVPVEPTESMLEAGADFEVLAFGEKHTFREIGGIYAAMLADAPQPDHIPGATKMVEPKQMAYWLAEHEAQLRKLDFGKGAPTHYELEFWIDRSRCRSTPGPDPLFLIEKAMRGEK